MDLSKFDTSAANETGVSLTLVDPSTGEDLANDGKKTKIWLVGKDSKEFRAFKMEQANKYRQKQPTPAQNERMSIEVLVRCTRRLENVLVDGVVLEHSFETTFDLYKRFGFIKDQVDEFIVDNNNFLGNSPAA